MADLWQESNAISPDLARWLMEQGIESLSLNPDTVVSTWMALAEAPKTGKKSAAA